MKHPYFIVDAHCDTIGYLFNQGKELKTNDRHLNIDCMNQYKGYIQFFASWIDRNAENCLSQALGMFDAFYRELEKNKDTLQQITDSDTLHKAINENKIGAMLTVEDARALCGELANLRMFYKLGVRAVGLTWNHDNGVAEGALSNSGAGLTDFGRDVVREMNRLGMIVDVSHTSKKAFWDVLETSEKPVMASHSNTEAICAHPRNLDDEQIRAIIKSRGMIGINIYPVFLSDSETANIDDIIRHIDHILSLGGEKVLGMGTDFDGISSTPTDINNVGELYKLFDKMKKMGYQDSLITAITHGNFVNFLEKMLKNEKN
ncbi:MAG: dipeptidase [Clostridia bacterium]|nr:dipeptidase [Clostridia bacterium]